MLEIPRHFAFQAKCHPFFTKGELKTKTPLLHSWRTGDCIGHVVRYALLAMAPSRHCEER